MEIELQVFQMTWELGGKTPKMPLLVTRLKTNIK